MFDFPTIDMVKTGQNIMRLRMQNGFSVKDLQDVFGFATPQAIYKWQHYPMLSWPKSRHGSIHLHGHIHSKGDYNLQQREEGILRYDVGVDANNFFPVSITEVKKFFNK